MCIRDSFTGERIIAVHQAAAHLPRKQFPCGLDDAGGRGILLQASDLAAAAAAGWVIGHLDVTNLSARTMDPCEQFPTHQDPAAYTSAQGDKDRILLASASADADLTQRRRIGVIEHLARPAAHTGQLIRRVESAPAVQVDAGFYKAVVQHCAWNANAYTCLLYTSNLPDFVGHTNDKIAAFRDDLIVSVLKMHRKM